MVVTFSNQYGSGAVAIAARVAELLGYDLVDRQLPVVVAKRLRISPETVEASEDTLPSLGERLLSGLELATPELAESSAGAPFDGEVLSALEDAVRERAQRGDAVIVGRGAGAILGPRPDLLRVFLHAPRAWRIERAIEATGADRRSVEAEVDRVDRARAEYLRERYGLTFGDPRNYDLCLDASRFDADACAGLVAAAARARRA